MMYVGEALAGERNEIAHIDLLIGDKDGPVGAGLPRPHRRSSKSGGSLVPASGEEPTVLIQLDGDPQPSVFDAVVAIDAGVGHLLRHGGVAPEAVRDLVYGAIGVGGLKMRIHKAAVRRLFEANDLVLDAEGVFELGRAGEERGA